MSNINKQNVEMANNGKNGLIDLNKHIDTARWANTKNQEETIKMIFMREFWHNKEYEITNSAPKLYIPDLVILGYKKPEKAVKSLLNKGVVKQLDNNTIELITKVVYCNQCRNREIFIWEKEDHLTKFHYWSEIVKKHNVMDTEFSNKPFPNKIDHDYEQISELKDNKIQVKCKNCNYERTIYIENRADCDPYRKSVYIQNPEDERNIEVRYNNTKIILKNQEELKQFIKSKIEEIDN